MSEHTKEDQLMILQGILLGKDSTERFFGYIRNFVFILLSPSPYRYLLPISQAVIPNDNNALYYMTVSILC